MPDQRNGDQEPHDASHYERLDPALNRPELAGIGITGTVGIGALVGSGSVITTTGSLGGPTSYLIAGGVVGSVLHTLTEMVASRPLTGALIDLPHTFLDPAAGFAVAVSYALANIFSMATLTAYSAEMTALLKDKPQRHPPGVEVGIQIAFLALTTISHCFGVQFYGKLERVLMYYKLCLLILVAIIGLVINVGAAGPRQGSYRGNYTTFAFPPGWKPAGFNSTNDNFIATHDVPENNFGIPGPGGRFFGLLTGITSAVFACGGGEMVAMTAGEAKNPWKDVPVVMSFVYVIPLTLYPFVIMSAGANVNYADPNLATRWGAGKNQIPLSPFAVAVSSSTLWRLTKVLYFFFILSAYTAANTGLYVSSRSVFVLSQKYMPSRVAKIFGKTNNGNTPLAAILLCSVFGFLSLTGLSHHAYDQARQTMSGFYIGSLASVYLCLCLTFLKFKAGLNRLKKRGVLKRDETLYRTRLFRSRWQPTLAYVGIIGCSLIIIWSGIPPLLILGAKPRLTLSGYLKSGPALVFDVLGAYSGPLLFALFYLSYKFITPHSTSVDVSTLTPHDYLLENPDGANFAPSRSQEDVLPPLIATQPARRDDPIALDEIQPHSPAPTGASSSSPFDADDRRASEPNAGLTPDELDELHAEQALKEERLMVKTILENRPRRMEGPLIKELWSCIKETSRPPPPAASTNQNV